MEKDEEQPVASPAPENVNKVDSPQEQDQNINSNNIPTNNELSDDKTVGPTPTTDTHVDQEIETSKIENTAKDEPVTEKEDKKEGNLVNDTAVGIETKSLEENNSTDSKSENSINADSGEPDIQKEDQEKGNLVNNATVSHTATNTDIKDHVDANSTENNPSSSQLPNSENMVNVAVGESNDQNKDQNKGNSVNDTKVESNDQVGATLSEETGDMKTDPKDNIIVTENSSSSSTVQLSNTEELVNIPVDEPDAKKEDQKEGNLVNDTAVDTETKSLEQNNATDLNSENSIKANSGEPDIQKEDEQRGNLVNDNSTDNNPSSSQLSNSENLVNVVDGKSAGQNEDQNKGNSVNDTKDELNNSSSKNEPGLVLFTVSNIFRKLSRKPNEQITCNEKDKKISEESDELLESPELKPIKGRIILYTKLWSEDCKIARKLLRKRKLRYSEINIDVYPSRKTELEALTGSTDVPKVYFNQVLIGGLNELKDLDDAKIEYVTNEAASAKAPLPPFSGEDDVSSKGAVDELAVVVKKMKETIVVKDRFYKFRRVTNCFLGSEAVDFLSQDQVLEREEAVEFARKLAKELFFRHVCEENIFEDGNHVYRFLDQDPIISECQNIPRGIIQLKRQPIEDLSYRLTFLLYAILDAYTSQDGRYIAYRTIHGSEEFARYLRIAEELQRVDLSKTTKEERLAFFINLYNLMAIHGILVWGHPEGALDRRKFFNDFKYVIGGSAYSLSDIYDGILRANQRPPYTLTKPFGLNDKRFKVALPYPEPLVHFALVSGNRSGPALRCYSTKSIDTELMKAAKDFLQSGGFVLDLGSMTISLSQILKWYSVDFGRNEVELLKHAANYLEVEKTQSLLELLDSNHLKVVYQPFDWSLNS